MCRTEHQVPNLRVTRMKDKRLITVSTCYECPYRIYDNGGGYCGTSEKCTKWHFLISDEDGTVKHFDSKSGIHPKCKLQMTC